MLKKKDNKEEIKNRIHDTLLVLSTYRDIRTAYGRIFCNIMFKSKLTKCFITIETIIAFIYRARRTKLVCVRYIRVTTLSNKGAHE